MMGRASKIVCLLLLTISLLVTAKASDDIVINHVLTDRIIEAQDDSLYIGQVLLGFTVGRAKFYTLTQVVLDKGVYRGKATIEDVNDKVIADLEFTQIVAETDNSLHSLVGTWDVQFKEPGMYQVVIYINNKREAQYKFVVVEKEGQ